MSDEQPAPERIWLSRGNARGSWEFSGCWGIHPFGAGDNVEYRRVEPPSESEREAGKELIEAIASPWICVEEKPCEETVAIHWEELITALTAAIAAAQQRGAELQREAAAQIADGVAKIANAEWGAAYRRNDSSPMKVYNGRRLVSEEIAAAIRATKLSPPSENN